jgi:hypothetical protein
MEFYTLKLQYLHIDRQRLVPENGYALCRWRGRPVNIRDAWKNRLSSYTVYSFLCTLLSVHSSDNSMWYVAFKILAQGGILFPLLINQRTNSMDVSPSGATSLLTCSRISQNIAWPSVTYYRAPNYSTVVPVLSQKKYSPYHRYFFKIYFNIVLSPTSLSS